MIVKIDLDNVIPKMIDLCIDIHKQAISHVDAVRIAELLENSAVEPVNQGKWISASTKPGVQIGMKCSLCGARIKYSEFFNGNHNYCHKCGAKMIKENN